jgi:hypothetical protein
VLLVAPRQGAAAGSPQSRATSVFSSNLASGGLAGPGGAPGVATPGQGGTPNGPIGFARRGTAGTPGAPGLGIGGGLALSSAGSATLKDTSIALNQASSGDPDIVGTFAQ